MSDITKMIPLLSLIASLFIRLDEEEYDQLLRSAAKGKLEDWALVSTQDGVEGEGGRLGLVLPSWSVRASLQNEVLTAGMPLAALPVESLYQPWSTVTGGAYGSQRGLYLGDAAEHIQALCDSLELQIPEEFKATPDHVSLLIDLLCVFLENGNEPAARDFIADHFGWLGLYEASLARKTDEVAQSPGLDEARRATLLEGLRHLVALVSLLDRLFCACGVDEHEGCKRAEGELAACLSR